MGILIVGRKSLKRLPPFVSDGDVRGLTSYPTYGDWVVEVGWALPTIGYNCTLCGYWNIGGQCPPYITYLRRKALEAFSPYGSSHHRSLFTIYPSLITHHPS